MIVPSLFTEVEAHPNIIIDNTQNVFINNCPISEQSSVEDIVSIMGLPNETRVEVDNQTSLVYQDHGIIISSKDGYFSGFMLFYDLDYAIETNINRFLGTLSVENTFISTNSNQGILENIHGISFICDDKVLCVNDNNSMNVTMMARFKKDKISRLLYSIRN